MPRNRRSLGKRISHSKRVNKLSMTGMLIYTWLIPQYDDDGRIDGDPEDLKYNVLPRRGDVTVDQVAEEIESMAALGLVTWYEVDGKPYLQMDPDAWEENQTFKGVKRVNSKIPKYDPTAHRVYQYTRDGGPVHPKGGPCHPKGGPCHPEGCTSTPDRVDHATKSDHKRREEKGLLRKQPQADLLKPEKGNKGFTKVLRDSAPIVELANQVLGMNGAKSFKDVFKWVQKMTNESMHPGAIKETLQQIVNRWDSIEDPWPYSTSTCFNLSSKYGEKERIAEAEKLKKDLDAFLQTEQGQAITGLLSKSIKKVPDARAP